MRVLILLACLSAPCSAAVCGDCNRSGAVDVIDALRAAQLATGLLPTSDALCECDVVNPQAMPDVDVLDSLAIAQWCAGYVGVLACACP